MTAHKRATNGDNGLPVPPVDDDSEIEDPLEGILGSRTGCRYVKKKLLGQGSFGSVWRVEETATGSIFAAKVMDTNNMSAKDRGFVINEVKCLSRCNNANIIRHHASFNRGGMLLIIAEYADGGDLCRQIKVRQHAGRHFKEHEVLYIFLQLCLALDHIHGNNMMHRDLKSANVLLTTMGLVKLGDFGFSRQYEDSLSNPVGTTFCGTPYYLSPELWRRAPYSKKSEMWALGVVLYEVMMLKRPFGGRNMDELINNIVHARRAPLPNMYSDELRRVCDQLLSLDPAKRPSLRQLFQQPFIRRGLDSLRRSVETHKKIPPRTFSEIARNIDEVLRPGLPEYRGSSVTPHRGMLQRHTADRGWKDCELSLNAGGVSMRDVETGGVETVNLETLTSVCPVDAATAQEKYVFALKNQTGKAYWFKDLAEDSYDYWISALQKAISH
ncbi:Repressor of differentiation kinase 2 [Trypanosoma equiperdum]|uniref:non-specific serine/threonine protein kinase n=2 Tax=Trypanozoon TaxID=39700 RepID=Q57YR8_TRYB2|nr:serine/threonine-protein kinase A, putative [Trypanosoma brucei brucei TREU927]AAX69250.1 serine/threonine-protein kinase A, putative [Trypanosoma brucei]AAZ13475.1 serine/threonine-protein kinase A, putative [Trypanosoma brucei brucei TREU927]SCU67022.1 Repressor of differentiation kinase 2 [Trypanosoma equiperdum]